MASASHFMVSFPRGASERAGRKARQGVCACCALRGLLRKWGRGAFARRAAASRPDFTPPLGSQAGSSGGLRVWGVCLPACLPAVCFSSPLTTASFAFARPWFWSRFCRMPTWTAGIGPEANASPPGTCPGTCRVPGLGCFTGARETAEPWFSEAERRDRWPRLPGHLCYPLAARP